MTEETHISPSAPYSTAQVGIFLALAGCILFSIKPILIKIAYQYGGDATSIMTLRAFSSLPLYLVTFIFLCRSADNRSKVRQHGVKAALVGVMGYYLASFLDISSLAFISAQLERLLIFLFPTFVVLISWLIYGQKPSRNIVYSALLGYVGISLIVIHDFNSGGTWQLACNRFSSGICLLLGVEQAVDHPARQFAVYQHRDGLRRYRDTGSPAG